MIEGLRAAPWWNEARSKGEVQDCETCMKRNSPTQRRYLGCGYMADAEKAAFQAKPIARNEENAESWETCPGYTTALPDVIDASHAYAWAKEGQLREYCHDETPAPAMLAAVGVMRGSMRGYESHKMRHPDKEKP